MSGADRTFDLIEEEARAYARRNNVQIDLVRLHRRVNDALRPFRNRFGDTRDTSAPRIKGVGAPHLVRDEEFERRITRANLPLCHVPPNGRPSMTSYQARCAERDLAVVERNALQATLNAVTERLTAVSLDRDSLKEQNARFVARTEQLTKEYAAASADLAGARSAYEELHQRYCNLEEEVEHLRRPEPDEEENTHDPGSDVFRQSVMDDEVPASPRAANTVVDAPEVPTEASGALKDEEPDEDALTSEDLVKL